MKLIARIAVILAFALLAVGATVALNASRSTTMPTPPVSLSQTSGQPGSVALDGQSATTASNSQAGQVATASDAPTGARPAGASHQEGGSQGWRGILKNVAVMVGLVVAVDIVTRLLRRVRPRSVAATRASG